MAKKVIKKQEAVEESVDVVEEAPKAVSAKTPSQDDEVTVSIPVRVKISRRVFEPGIHKIPRHMLATIKEIVDKKTRADISIFTGKNYLVDRLAGGALSVKEVKSLK